MSYEKELLEVAIYQCGKLTPNEEDRLYKWIESLEVAKRKADEYEAKAKAYDLLRSNLEKEVKILIDEVSGFPYVDAPIESTISHFEHVLELMKKYEEDNDD